MAVLLPLVKRLGILKTLKFVKIKRFDLLKIGVRYGSSVFFWNGGQINLH
ncbi:hypothetical protein Cabys_412 [Caldithrix abyssi DSM 13497]|uniref:Uncharacterized protein n=1 Tax=Caldithrix abyssi DSM 13497 TaxID=880073 RepID=A0A1J1C3A2_CALAY|nr:hypothetical protein Cabys_412 [Caldithrix abyssi DSM 13497]